MRKLEKIINNLNQYPPSTKNKGVIYDVEKLFFALNKKEAQLVLPDKIKRKQSFQLANKYSNYAQYIIRGERTNKEIIDFFDRCDNKMQEKLSDDYYLYVLQWALPVKALFYYKIKKYQKALEVTKRCIEIMDELVKKGMYTYLFRIIEQNKNISIIYNKIGEVENQLCINADILSYYFNGPLSSNLLSGNVFKKKWLWEEMIYLRECNGYVYFRNIVDLFFLEPDEFNFSQFKANFYKLFKKIHTMKVDNLDREIFFQWLEIQMNFYSMDYNLFFDGTNTFLNEKTNLFHDPLKKVLLNELIYLGKREHFQLTKNQSYYYNLVKNQLELSI